MYTKVLLCSTAHIVEVRVQIKMKKLNYFSSSELMERKKRQRTQFIETRHGVARSCRQNISGQHEAEPRLEVSRMQQAVERDCVLQI
jgi:hypothetical protein